MNAILITTSIVSIVLNIIIIFMLLKHWKDN